MSSSKPALVIQPIDFDVATRAVDKFTKEREIPTMVFPVQGDGKGREGASQAPAPIAKLRKPVTRVPLDLPDYAYDELRRRALAGRCSARYIVMKALQVYGITIAEDDMPEDGRRTNALHK